MTGSGFSSGTDETSGRPADGPIPFELVAHHAPCPWALLDAGGRYRYISPAFVETFGYTLDDLRSDRDWFERAFPDPAERERVLSAWCEDDGRRPEGPHLYRVRCRDGLDRSVLLRHVALDDGSRLEVYEDVSELVQNHEALLTVNRRLMDIIEFLPDPTFVIDREGTVIAWNRAIEAMSGVPKEEMLGRGNDAYAAAFYGSARPLLIDLVIHGAEEGLDPYTEVEAGPGTLVAETFVPSWNDGSGAYLWGKASLLYTPAGEVAGAIESIRDITERRRTDQQLRRSERKYRDLVESINDIIYAIDPAGRITYVSPVIAHVSGYTPAEVTGRSYFELVHPDDLEIARWGLAEVIAGRGGPNEFRMLARSGETRWVRTFTRPVEIDGAVVELRGVLTDITEQKLAEIALRRSEALLARMCPRSRGPPGVWSTTSGSCNERNSSTSSRALKSSTHRRATATFCCDMPCAVSRQTCCFRAKRGSLLGAVLERALDARLEGIEAVERERLGAPEPAASAGAPPVRTMVREDAVEQRRPPVRRQAIAG
jgi:PAS domain S-box-containing protein